VQRRRPRLRVRNVPLRLRLHRLRPARLDAIAAAAHAAPAPFPPVAPVSAVAAAIAAHDSWPLQRDVQLGLRRRL
jgi:hypothetical protein